MNMCEIIWCLLGLAKYQGTWVPICWYCGLGISSLLKRDTRVPCKQIWSVHFDFIHYAFCSFVLFFVFVFVFVLFFHFDQALIDNKIMINDFRKINQISVCVYLWFCTLVYVDLRESRIHLAFYYKKYSIAEQA